MVARVRTVFNNVFGFGKERAADDFLCRVDEPAFLSDAEHPAYHSVRQYVMILSLLQSGGRLPAAFPISYELVFVCELFIHQ